MKKTLMALFMLLGAAAGNAYAIPVEFDVVDLFNWGRLYSYDGASYTPTNVNPFDGSAGSVIPQNTVGNADGSEDSWGIAQIDQVQPIGGGPLFFDKELDPYELSIFFYGFDDDTLTSPDFLGDVTIGTVGGRVQIYQDFSQDYDPSLGTGGRTGVDSYTTATNGTLVLDLTPVAQNAAGHTLKEDFNFMTLVGSGSVFLETTGAGAWDSLFDTNTQLFGSDFSFSFTSRNNINPRIGDWTVRGDGRAEGNVIPEPASMFLMGSGLIGMLGARSRKRKLA
ncbi:MAG: PEP-CTERM sorting domain-containing protein [Candidatus Omnitrophica bacterium]|nr:PEP-CTERM sorting domain-containing protein [Candidatus Omnitrophota bacterium]